MKSQGNSQLKVKGQKLKVFVGLSGGVDSSVSAALLKAAKPNNFQKLFGRQTPKGFSGYAVTGVFIRVWQPDFFECAWKDDRLDAMRVCAKLNIPFRELNLEKEYKLEVVDYMIREYKAGKTPNPDVSCNRFIKFGAFYRWARAEGADFVATGHYAQIVKTQSTGRTKNQTKNKTQNSKLLTTNYSLLTSSDSQKDQSYFLWQIRKEQLPHILFPVGGMKKPEVRRIAKKSGLITADKKDSQGLCFIGKIDMKEFLRHYIREKHGKVLDEEGREIGAHRGVTFYTIGERISFATRSKLWLRLNLNQIHPYYVIAKDVKRNTLTVSNKLQDGTLPDGVGEVTITKCNWLSEPIIGKKYMVRVRYRQELLSARIIIRNSRFIIHFASPQTVASGQSLVLYDGDICLGGGIIG